MRCTLRYAQALTWTISELGKFNLILIYSGLSRLVGGGEEEEEDEGRKGKWKKEAQQLLV